MSVCLTCLLQIHHRQYDLWDGVTFVHVKNVAVCFKIVSVEEHCEWSTISVIDSEDINDIEEVDIFTVNISLVFPVPLEVQGRCEIWRPDAAMQEQTQIERLPYTPSELGYLYECRNTENEFVVYAQLAEAQRQLAMSEETVQLAQQQLMLSEKTVQELTDHILQQPTPTLTVEGIVEFLLEGAEV